MGMWYVYDRENWAGRIATHICEMVRLSRTDSLVGGHLIVKWYERNGKKCEEMWGWVIRSRFDEDWYGLNFIEFELNLVDGLCWWFGWELFGLRIALLKIILVELEMCFNCEIDLNSIFMVYTSLYYLFLLPYLC